MSKLSELKKKLLSNQEVKNHYDNLKPEFDVAKDKIKKVDNN